MATNKSLPAKVFKAKLRRVLPFTKGELLPSMSAVCIHKSTCRICRSAALTKVLSFGPTPLANAFLGKSDLHIHERYFPLDVHLCAQCGLVQLGDVVDPRVLFQDYVYVSSTSPVFVAHFEMFAKEIFNRFGLSKESLVIDIGSNDGILLRPFRKLGARVLGVEPDRTIAAIARKNGVETMSEFFSPAVAEKIAKKYGAADVITATNVFAHVDDIHALVRGVKHLLKKDGTFIIEVPYIVDFLRKNLFDTVYHEHLSYFGLSALNAFFERAGMTVIDAERIPTHGGSLRVFAQKKGAARKPSPSVLRLIAAEKKQRIHEEETYRAYTLRIQKNRAKLLTLLAGLKEKGKSIAGYGAPAKGNTLLNYFSIGNDTLDYIVDDSPHKQGKYTPGKRIPVVSAKMLHANPPDYLLILAWNFAETIMKKNELFRKNGGKFIIPVPHPRIVD